MTSGNRSVMVCLTRRHQYVVVPTARRKWTHMSFHVARPNAALVTMIQQSEPKPDVKKTEYTYFAVSFPNFAMITPPLTLPIAGFEERLGCSIFSIPPSPKIWSVHGSMYDREGGCMSVRKASKDCVIFIIESAAKCYGQLTMTNITANSDFANLDIILEEDLPGGARRPSRQFQSWCQVI